MITKGRERSQEGMITLCESITKTFSWKYGRQEPGQYLNEAGSYDKYIR
jgi:hypothetical protein